MTNNQKPDFKKIIMLIISVPILVLIITLITPTYKYDTNKEGSFTYEH